MVDRSDSHMRYENIAGTLLFGAGVIAFLGIITAETLYPGYSTSQNMISDLGEPTLPTVSLCNLRQASSVLQWLFAAS